MYAYYHGGAISPGRGWVMVRTGKLDARELIEAMRRGDFYGSSGIVLRDVRYDRKTRVLSIEIVPDGNASFTTEFFGTMAGYDATSRDTVDQAGKKIATTRTYSADVGKVLATKKGRSVRYQLTGKELYVRATVTSTRPPMNPSYKGQLKQAWTQPVGWRSHVENPGPTRLHLK